MKIKKYILLFLVLFSLSSISFAQFDERFYFPSKEYNLNSNLNHEDLFYTIDEVKIHVLLLKPQIKAKSTIVFFMGAGGNAPRYTYMVEPLVETGYQVFMIEPRGYGLSNGIPTHLTVVSDAQIVFDSIINMERVKNTKVLIYGASLGTQAAVHIAKNNQKKVDALVLDGTISSFTDIALSSTPEEQKQIIINYVTSPYAAKEDIKEIKNMPKLFIHSKADQSVPFAQGDLVYKNAKQPKSRWIFKGGHLDCSIKNKELFVQKMDSLNASISGKKGSGTYQINIVIKDLKSNKGQVCLELKDTLENVIKTINGKIVNKQCNLIFKDIADGKYTIVYYHDENNNNELDSNFIGIPKEGYGFSNNASGAYGPPPIEEQTFEVIDNVSMVLKPFYR